MLPGPRSESLSYRIGRSALAERCSSPGNGPVTVMLRLCDNLRIGWEGTAIDKVGRGKISAPGRRDGHHCGGAWMGLRTAKGRFETGPVGTGPWDRPNSVCSVVGGPS